ncbi:MAG TPA: hypothetical protein VGI61_02385 [Parafilimonas sp.]
MKKLILLPFVCLLFVSCDSKKESIIDSQKMINKRITGLADSLQHVGDSASLNRIKAEIRVEQLRFDSLTNELNKLKK